MALLKDTKIAGNLIVEGSIKSKQTVGAGADGNPYFPNYEESLPDNLVKFENENSKIRSAELREAKRYENGDYSTLYDYQGKSGLFSFSKLDIDVNIANTSTFNSDIITIYPGTPEAGDLYTTIGGITYTTSFSLMEPRFIYKDQLTPNEEGIGGLWAGLGVNNSYEGTWPTNKKGLAIYPSLLQDDSGNENLCWDGSYASNKLGPNGYYRIGDGPYNTNLYTTSLKDKTDSLFHWLYLFNNNQHPTLPNNTGFNDWFIPSANEIFFMFDNLRNPLPAQNYWTSEEHSSYDSACMVANKEGKWVREALVKSSNSAKVILARYF